MDALNLSNMQTSPSSLRSDVELKADDMVPELEDDDTMPELEVNDMVPEIASNVSDPNTELIKEYMDNKYDGPSPHYGSYKKLVRALRNQNSELSTHAHTRHISHFCCRLTGAMMMRETNTRGLYIYTEQGADTYDIVQALVKIYGYVVHETPANGNDRYILS